MVQQKIRKKKNPGGKTGQRTPAEGSGDKGTQPKRTSKRKSDVQAFERKVVFLDGKKMEAPAREGEKSMTTRVRTVVERGNEPLRHCDRRISSYSKEKKRGKGQKYEKQKKSSIESATEKKVGLRGSSCLVSTSEIPKKEGKKSESLVPWRKARGHAQGCKEGHTDSPQ